MPNLLLCLRVVLFYHARLLVRWSCGGEIICKGHGGHVEYRQALQKLVCRVVVLICRSRKVVRGSGVQPPNGKDLAPSNSIAGMREPRILGRIWYAEPVECGQREDIDCIVLNGIVSEAPAIASVDEAKPIVSTFSEHSLGGERISHLIGAVR